MSSGNPGGGVGSGTTNRPYNVLEGGFVQFDNGSVVDLKTEAGVDAAEHNLTDEELNELKRAMMGLGYKFANGIFVADDRYNKKRNDTQLSGPTSTKDGMTEGDAMLVENVFAPLGLPNPYNANTTERLHATLQNEPAFQNMVSAVRHHVNSTSGSNFEEEDRGFGLSSGDESDPLNLGALKNWRQDGQSGGPNGPSVKNAGPNGVQNNGRINTVGGPGSGGTLAGSSDFAGRWAELQQKFPKGNDMEVLFIVMRESIHEVNLDKRYFLMRLEEMNKIGKALADQMRVLNQAIRDLEDLKTNKDNRGKATNDKMQMKIGVYINDVNLSTLGPDGQPIVTPRPSKDGGTVHNLTSTGLNTAVKDLENQQEELRNKRQMMQSAFQNFDQKGNQLFNQLATIVKTIHEMRSSTIRNML